MMKFKLALLPSLVLGLMLAVAPVQQADAKEKTPAKVKVAKSEKKATTDKTAKNKDKKASSSKIIAKKAEKNKKIAKETAKNKTDLAAEKKKNAKEARLAEKKQAERQKERLAERKERTRERLAQVSRTGRVAKVAKYAARPVVVAAAATSATAAIAANQISKPVIEQSRDIAQSLNLESKAALIMNASTGEVLYAKNTNQAVPIASITKLMTAMVVLDAKLPLDEAITINEEDIDRMRNTSSRLSVGTVLSRAELLLLALMSSENRAAHALARTYPGGVNAAVAAMNRKAATLGMTQTRFEDGTGLNSGNVASPKDLVTMVKTASTYPLIRRFSTTGGHAVAIKDSVQQFNNTNALVKNQDWEIGVSKTGFINEAGKCLVMQAKIKSTPVVMVLMDSWGKYTRVGDAVRVKKWLETSSGN